MQEPAQTTPRIHKRSSSLPQAREILDIEQEAPVPPLKVGSRHTRWKSSSSEVGTGLGFYVEPWQVRPAAHPQTPPAIPERHLARQAFSSSIVARGERDDDERRHSSSTNSSGTENVPSLISLSSDGSDCYYETALQCFYSCVRELYQSERQFCLELSVAVHDMMLKTLDIGISKRRMAIIFNNLPEVYGISTGLVRLIEALVPEWILVGDYGHDSDFDLPTQVGRAMCMWLNGDVYRVYELYVHGNTAQVKMFQRTAVKYPALHMCAGGSNAQTSPLRSILQKPVQRISQYPIFLKAMLDVIPSTHADTLEILSAYERARSYCRSINARMERPILGADISND